MEKGEPDMEELKKYQDKEMKDLIDSYNLVRPYNNAVLDNIPEEAIEAEELPVQNRCHIKMIHNDCSHLKGYQGYRVMKYIGIRDKHMKMNPKMTPAQKLLMMEEVNEAKEIDLKNLLLREEYSCIRIKRDINYIPRAAAAFYYGNQKHYMKVIDKV
jgi:hypothetical protein